MFSTVEYETAKEARMCGYHDAYVTVIEAIKTSDNYADAMYIIEHMLQFAYALNEHNITDDGPFNDFMYTQIYIETLSKLIDTFRWNHISTSDNNNMKDVYAYMNTDIVNTADYFIKRVL